MPDQICSASAWLPVVGTLLGAAVGFAASFAVAWFNQQKSELASKGDRQRVRLEELYRTLVEIRKDYQSMLSQIFSKVHDNTAIVAPSYSNLPPIINAEMLVKLYFPLLIPFFVRFEEAKDAFGSKFADAIVSNTSSLPLKEKQKICGDVMASFQVIDTSITNFQSEISRIIQA